MDDFSAQTVAMFPWLFANFWVPPQEFGEHVVAAVRLLPKERWDRREREL